MKLAHNILVIALALSAIAPSTVRANTGAIVAGTAMIASAIIGKYASSKVATASTKSEKDNYTLLKWLGYGASAVSGMATVYLLISRKSTTSLPAPNQNPDPQDLARQVNETAFQNRARAVRNIINQLEHAQPEANIQEMRNNALAAIDHLIRMPNAFNREETRNYLTEVLNRAFDQAQIRLAQAAPVQPAPAPAPVPAATPVQAREALPRLVPADLADVRQPIDALRDAARNELEIENENANEIIEAMADQAVLQDDQQLEDHAMAEPLIPVHQEVLNHVRAQLDAQRHIAPAA